MSLSLGGIFSDQDGDVHAMINDEIYDVGDSVKGYTIRDMTHNRVFLEKNDKRYSMGMDSGLREIKSEGTLEP